MPNHDPQELLQPRPPPLDNIVTKPIRKHLARQRRYRDPRALPLQDIPEILEIGIPPPHRRLPKLEGRDIRPAHDLVVGVHVPADAVGSRVPDLDLEEVLGGPVDLVEGLGPGGGHCGEDAGGGAGGGGRGGGCGV